MNPLRPRRLVLVATSILALIAACSAPGASTTAGITVTDAWARSSSAMASAGAAYATITNAGTVADALIGASSPAARTVEVHETVAIDGAMPSASGGMGTASPMPSASGGMGTASPMPSASGGMGTASANPSASGGGMMGMRPVARVEIAAGGSLQLKPGSYHVMLIGLVKDLTIGDTIELTLKFEKAGEITVNAQVRGS